MTAINFFITEDAVNNMTAVDYEAFERAQDGDIKVYRLRPALCRFMVDEKNTPIPYERALKISEQLKIGQLKEFVTKFFDVMSNKAIPKVSGNSSPQPSEAPTAVSESQAG